jgi:uncharacterized GH25 family protein
MHGKYPEIIQFFRDTKEQAKLQMAANEYQSFAKTYYRMKAIHKFRYQSLDSDIFTKLKEKHLEILRHPKLSQVII